MIINQLFAEKLVTVLGWTILHSIWQGLVVGLILLFVLLMLRDQSAKFKYNFAFTLSLILTGVSLFTFGYLYQHYTVQPIHVITSQENITPELINSVQAENMSFGNLVNYYFNLLGLQRYLPFIVVFWGLGVIFLSIRFTGGLLYAHRLGQIYTVPVSHIWQERLDMLARKINITQKITLLESAKVKIPVVIGFLKPVILLPLGYLTGLPQSQVEAILAHELSHIGRRDYLVNIIYSMISILFFYHPVIWWISYIIRQERENCCDDMAIDITGDKLTLARALTAVYENQEAPVAVMALFKHKNMLYDRIKRLTCKPSQELNPLGGLLISTLFFIGALILFVNARAQFLVDKDLVPEPNPVVETVNLDMIIPEVELTNIEDIPVVPEMAPYLASTIPPVTVPQVDSHPLPFRPLAAMLPAAPAVPDSSPNNNMFFYDYTVPFIPSMIKLDSLDQFLKLQQEFIDKSLPLINNLILPTDSIIAPFLKFNFDTTFAKMPPFPSTGPWPIPYMPFMFTDDQFDSTKFKMVMDNIKNIQINMDSIGKYIIKADELNHFKPDSSQLKNIASVFNSFQMQFDSSKFAEMQKNFKNIYALIDTARLYESFEKMKTQQFDMQKMREKQLYEMERQRELLDKQIQKMHKEMEQQQEKNQSYQESLKSQKEQRDLVAKQLQVLLHEIEKSEKERDKADSEQISETLKAQQEKKKLMEQKLKQIEEEVKKSEQKLKKQQAEKEKSKNN